MRPLGEIVSVILVNLIGFWICDGALLENLLKKGMAIHSSSLAWIIPRTEEPGKLQFMGAQRVGHN